MDAKKQNHKQLDDLQAQVATIWFVAYTKQRTAIFKQLEDVQQAYTMDEIRFEEKYEDTLARYQNERDTERKEYEVS